MPKTEVHLGNAGLDETGEGDPRALLSREPDPALVALMQDEWERALASQPRLIQAAMILRRDGYSWEEIGARVNLHPKVVQRRIRVLLKLPFDW